MLNNLTVRVKKWYRSYCAGTFDDFDAGEKDTASTVTLWTRSAVWAKCANTLTVESLGKLWTNLRQYWYAIKANENIPKYRNKLIEMCSYQMRIVPVSKQIEDAPVICDICMERPKNVALIPCGHTFCLACIIKANTYISLQTNMKCPICRNGVTGFFSIFI